MSNVSKPADQSTSGRGSTPVPPRAGKGKGGTAAGRPQPNRNRGRQARQAAQRRNRMYGLVAVLVVVVIVAVVVIIGVSSGGSSAPRKPASPAAVTQMENVSTATLADAASKVQGLNYASTAAGGPLTSNGKPEVLYIGAEFCPVCAAERWPMTIALMKFGKFTNLQETRSAKADGDTGTWSYFGATYTSQYLTFVAQELYTNQPSGGYYKPLEKVTSAHQTIWAANEGSNLSFPFIDFAGKEVLTTAQFNPQTIYYHPFSWVLGAVGTNDNTTGAQIDASAAVFTKYLCGLTNNQPGDVCSAVAKVNAPVTQSTSGQQSPAGG